MIYKKIKVACCKKGFVLLMSWVLMSSFAYAARDVREFYQIKIYQLKNDEQVKMVDVYLQNTYLPALHRAGIKQIGVFKPIGNDTAGKKFIYVLIPFKSVDGWLKIDKKLAADANYKSAAESFTAAESTNSPYERMESILLEAFSGQPKLVLPSSKKQKGCLN